MVDFWRMGLHQRVSSFRIHDPLMVHPSCVQSINHLFIIVWRYDVIIGALPKICRRILLPHMLINAEIFERVAPSLATYRINKSIV